MPKLIAAAIAANLLIVSVYLMMSHVFLIALAYKGKVEPWLAFALMPGTIALGTALALAALHIGGRYGVWKLPEKTAN